jgi:hypothetical protein
MTAFVHWLSSLPIWLPVIVIIVLCLGMALLVVRIMRRRLPHPALVENNEFLGFTYAIYGLIYGLVLGLVIVTTWDHYTETEEIVLQETTVLSQLWRDGQAFPLNVRAQLHTDLYEYVSAVIDREWDTMARYGRGDAVAEEEYEDLWRHTYKIEPTSRNQEAFLKEYLSRINALSATRRLRILNSQADINPLLWLIMICGAIPTVVYTFLFSARHGIVQVMITTFMACLVALCLLAAAILQYPFTGHARISPEPFKVLKESCEHRWQEGL